MVEREQQWVDHLDLDGSCGEERRCGRLGSNQSEPPADFSEDAPPRWG